jgi:hypothetical protein
LRVPSERSTTTKRDSWARAGRAPPANVTAANASSSTIEVDFDFTQLSFSSERSD